MQFSNRINIQPSATMKMNGLAGEKRQKGEHVHNLSVGEPQMPTPQVIRDAAIAAIQSDKTTYPPANGLPELRKAASEWMNQSYGTNYTAAQTLVTCGGKFGLYGLCQSLLNPGDEALIVAPFWVSYSGMTELASAKPVILKTTEENGWKIQPNQIAEAANERTKILFLNNASNPTGGVYSREELEAILRVAKEKNIIVISDEVYSGLVYDGEYVSCGSFPEYKDSVIVVQSTSKHFGMTGWRVGLVFANEDVLKKLKTLQGQSITNTASISQWAALAAFQNADAVITEIKTEMQKRRDTFVETVNELFPGNITAPASALYAFIPLTTFGVQETDSTKFCMDTLERGNIAMVPGAAFGIEGYVRCSFGGKPEETRAAFEALKAFLS